MGNRILGFMPTRSLVRRGGTDPRAALIRSIEARDLGRSSRVAVSQSEGLVVASTGQRVVAWDLASGAEVGSCPSANWSITRLVIAPRRHVYVADLFVGVKRWVPATGAVELVAAMDDDGVEVLAIDARARWIAAGTRAGKVCVVGLEAGARPRTLATGLGALVVGHTSSVRCLALDPAGDRVAACADEAVVLLDPASDAPAVRLGDSGSNVYGLWFTPDGRALRGLASEPDRVCEWDLGSGAATEITRLGHNRYRSWYGSLSDAAGARVVSAGLGHELSVCDVSTGAVICEADGEVRQAWAAAIDLGGHLAATVRDRAVDLWDLDVLVSQIALDRHPGPVRRVGWDDRGLVVSQGGLLVLRFDPVSGRPLAPRRFDPAEGPITLLPGLRRALFRFAPRPRAVSSAFVDFTYATGPAVIDLEEGHALRPNQAWRPVPGMPDLPPPPFAIHGPTAPSEPAVRLVGAAGIVDGDGGTILASSWADGCFAVLRDGGGIFEVPAAPVVAPLSGQPLAVRRSGGVAIQASGTFVEAVATARGERVRLEPAHGSPVVWAGWSQAEDAIWSASLDGAIQRWDLTGRLTLSAPASSPRPAIRGHVFPPVGFALAPDGEHVITAGPDGLVLRFLLDDPGRDPIVLAGEPEGVCALALSENGRTLATCSTAGAIAIRDAETGAVTARAQAPASTMVLAVAPAGDVVFGGGEGGEVVAWDAGTGRVRWSRSLDARARITHALALKDGLVVMAGGVDYAFLRDGEVVAQGRSRDRITSIAPSPRGLLLGCEGGTLDHTELRGGPARFDIVRTSEYTNILTDNYRYFAPTALTTSPDGEGLVWTAIDGQLVITPPGSILRQSTWRLAPPGQGFVAVRANGKGAALFSDGTLAAFTLSGLGHEDLDRRFCRSVCARAPAIRRGRHLLSLAGTLRLWDLDAGIQRYERGLPAWSCADVDRDSGAAVLGCGTVLEVHDEAGEPVARWEAGAAITAVAIAGDGIACGDAQGAVTWLRMTESI
jgi:WD40 repeat protein